MKILIKFKYYQINYNQYENEMILEMEFLIVKD